MKRKTVRGTHSRRPGRATRPQANRPGDARVYFPGLNGLRFFAAMLVVFGHVELMKEHHGYGNIHSNLAVYETGRMAVTFFFVLSGFLITFLLLMEKEVSNTISVKRFYTRRMLRIWPLYFLLVLLAFFVLPRLSFFSVPALSAEMPVHLSSSSPRPRNRVARSRSATPSVIRLSRGSSVLPS